MESSKPAAQSIKSDAAVHKKQNFESRALPPCSTISKYNYTEEQRMKDMNILSEKVGPAEGFTF
ncbi:hypothetical protein [Pontibacter anaerobius]|uniref:Uncharacterized protein n=1 Tax=Pontibacter anaerobius TaxID=2993940 RepID=A0ABT3RL77_9BACT|nr:hypothetical protein [Pontibacter anaerobius]MCX2742134.1 hypothetical protein [Pontibacter anaerobius]